MQFRDCQRVAQSSAVDRATDRRVEVSFTLTPQRFQEILLRHVLGGSSALITLRGRMEERA
jgi:hypothetical protein